MKVIVNLRFLLFYRTEGKDLVVHFDIHVDPVYVDVEASDLKKILQNELNLAESLYFQNLTIDPNTLEVKASDVIPTPTTVVPSTMFVTQAVSQTAAPPRRCYPLGIRKSGITYITRVPIN